MKKYLLTGFVVVLPAVLTMIVIVFLFNLFTGPLVMPVSKLIDLIEFSLAFRIPASLTLILSRLLAIALLLGLILTLGMVTQLFIVKTLMHWLHLAINRIPLVKTIYQVSLDVFRALFSTDGTRAFKQPVVIPFPSKPNYSLGLASGEVAKEIQDKLDIPLVSVFVPTAPHPISGFLFIVPKKEVSEPDMTKEEVLKFLISCGTILPHSDPKADNE